VAASVAGMVMLLVGGSLAPGRMQDLPIDNPFGLGAMAGAVAWVALYTGVALHWASLVAAVLLTIPAA
jgi:hypothetical protein